MTWRIPPIGWCVTCWRKGEERPAWGLSEGTSLCKDCLREVLPKAREGDLAADTLAKVREAFDRTFSGDFGGFDWDNDAAVQDFALAVAPLLALTDAQAPRLPEDAPWPREECGNRGPRIGEDVTYCRRSKGHDMPHRVAPSDGHGNVEWRD